MNLPDKKGYFKNFGGRFIPETLFTALKEIEMGYLSARKDKKFWAELSYYLENYVGRPTPLYFAKNLTRQLGGAKIYLKREDLCHTGAHKINNTIGQALLAKRLGKKRLIAETGAGQHGVATATAAALFGFPCDVYMGTKDIKRQAMNVYRMELLGARVIPVDTGTRVLKDAIDETIRDWVTNVRTTHYLLGSCVGPHPYPLMVRDFQSVIGKEARRQILKAEGRLPDYLVACVGGGSNSLGLFHPFYNDPVKFIGVEAGGQGVSTGKHGASLGKGKVGILHGAKSYLLQDKEGQVRDTWSIAPGLDYPGVGPEHSFYKTTGRAKYVNVTDKKALEAIRLLSRTEGILPALETAHALAYLKELKTKKDEIVIVCFSGRGDKDIEIIQGSGSV